MSKRKSSGPSDGRRSMENYSSFDILPKEIVVEIVFRLPPESLMRLKSLNKSWNFLIQSLIDDPDFVAKHQRHAEENPAMLLINDPLEMKDELITPQRLRSAFITRLGDICCANENINVSHLPSSLTTETRTCIEAYHCNGVICLSKGHMRVFTLYSPVTGKFETFQPKPVGEDFQICGMGFGSDSGGSNFKAVRILFSMRAHIFTPGASDSWREIKISIQDRSYHLVYEHVYLKGYCFWIAADRFLTVLCFDVCNEAFREILLPNELDTFGGNFKLDTVDDSVCLFSYPYKEPIDVWVMDSNTYSWRKWLRIEPCEGFDCLLAFWGSDELLMKDENDEMVSYNIKTQKLRTVSPKVMLGWVFYLGVYVESLASAKWVL